MPRGGKHEGSLKPHWNAGKTCVIRVPESKKQDILAIAKALDQLDYNAEIVDKPSYQEALDILESALSFPRNNGSKHNKAIREALLLLGREVKR